MAKYQKKKSPYSPVRLVLRPTESQLAEIEAFFKSFRELSEWLDQNAPPELVKFRELDNWAYPKLREKKVGSYFAQKLAGKVSTMRMRKVEKPVEEQKPLDADYFFCDYRNFTFRNGELKIKLLDKPEIIDYEVAPGEMTKRFLNSVVIKSAVLRRGDKDFIFVLRVYPPKVMAYQGQRR